MSVKKLMQSISDTEFPCVFQGILCNSIAHHTAHRRRLRRNRRLHRNDVPVGCRGPPQPTCSLVHRASVACLRREDFESFYDISASTVDHFQPSYDDVCCCHQRRRAPHQKWATGVGMISFQHVGHPENQINTFSYLSHTIYQKHSSPDSCPLPTAPKLFQRVSLESFHPIFLYVHQF